MGLILLEALGALVALLLIVWWTMFSGRPRGEPPHRQHKADGEVHPPAPPPSAPQPPAPPPAD
ncbi:MAG: hypothetical protein KBF40_05345 [Giesbergeria sp.]|nr:hypothetical protein [Simplicispira sp.]MBP6120043.1 hypothetical protein [Giesbergeria sp.]MBP6158740.1 hypothetical protein [Giesbergeria sp.]MBP7083051.1 hypothetical protein [Giesbergeria sp.]MBP9783398.1 hypothetical protein [Giesbergeria sp.]